MNKENIKHQSDLKFKGYPLEEFLDPNALNIDNVAASPHLLKAVMQHVKAFTTGSGAVGTTADGDLTTGINDLSGGNLVTGHENPNSNFEGSLKNYLEGIYLGNFTSNALKAHPSRGAQLYVYDLGFNTDKRVGFIVDNPLDTLLTFGPAETSHPDNATDLIQSRVPRMSSFNVETKESVKREKGGKTIRFKETRVVKVNRTKGPSKHSKTCDLNLRIIVDNQNILQSFSLYGNSVEVGLSKSLVQPVYKLSSGKYVKTGRRFVFALGDRVITLRKNSLPTWGGSIELDGYIVSIRGNDLIGRLKRINLGGTVEKPLIVFDDVELIKQA